jgi:hypothetical protein
MTFLIAQIVTCLLLAALFGFTVGWALRSIVCRKKIGELDALQDLLQGGRKRSLSSSAGNRNREA